MLRKIGEPAIIRDLFSLQEGRSYDAWAPYGDRAARLGHLSLLDHLKSRGVKPIVTPAACIDQESGEPVGRNALEWLMKNGVPTSPRYGDLCVKRGDVETLRWLQQRVNLPCTFQAAVYAAQAGRINDLDMLVTEFGLPLNSKLLEVAVESGKLDMVRHLVAKGVRISESAFMDALCGGDGEIARFLGAQRPELLSSPKWVTVTISKGMLDEFKWLVPHHPEGAQFRPHLDRAARNGHLHVIEYLHNHYEARATARAMTDAAANGHLEVVQFLAGRRNEGAEQNVMDLCAEHGQLAILQWFHEFTNYTCSVEAMDKAAEHGHLDVVRWLHFNRTEGCTTDAIDLAAQNGHLEIVEFLHAARTEGATIQAMDFAAGKGHLGVVEFLHGNRTEGASTRAMDMAAEGGHLEVVKWLTANRTEGCTRLAFDFAAGNGHLEVAKWLSDHYDLGFSSAAVEIAARGGHLPVLVWLEEHFPQVFAEALTEEGVKDGDFLVRVEQSNVREIARMRVFHGAHYSNGTANKSEAIDLAIRSGHVDVAAWLHQRGFQPSSSAFDWAARNGHLEMLIWLHESLHITPTKYATDWAVMEENLDVLSWMWHASVTSKEQIKRYAQMYGHIYMLEWLDPASAPAEIKLATPERRRYAVSQVFL